MEAAHPVLVVAFRVGYKAADAAVRPTAPSVWDHQPMEAAHPVLVVAFRVGYKAVATALEAPPLMGSDWQSRQLEARQPLE